MRHGDVTGVLELECRPSTVGGSVGVRGTPGICVVRESNGFVLRVLERVKRFPETWHQTLILFSPSIKIRNIAPLPCREPLASLGTSHEFHLTACQCIFAYFMRSLTFSNRLPKTYCHTLPVSFAYTV
ncbi:hypothetical protein T01_8953 [Trichinella spiralis]|uniref:Uncharacterized protein n=1 Tax=Trichinella spiralis TaxID=6334 RepID=A0A0V1AQB5_TRISP|nr:hypothetical protein T01_8953 [Trichinella spiralis]